METSSFSVSSSQAVMIEVASFFKSSLTAWVMDSSRRLERIGYSMETFPVFSVAIFDFTLNASEALESFCVSTSEDPAFEASVFEESLFELSAAGSAFVSLEVVSAMVSAADV